MTTTKGLEARIGVLERKLDATIRALHLLTVSAKPASEWLDSSIEKIDDPAQIGVKHGN